MSHKSDKSKCRSKYLLMVCLSVLAAIILSSCAGAFSDWFSSHKILKEYQLSRQTTNKALMLTSLSSDELYGRLSPDGKGLLYTSNQKGNLDIWIKNLTNGIPQKITSHLSTDTQATFSPDGKRIVFISMRDDVKGDVYLLTLGNDDLLKLTDRTTADAYPIFAPNGKSIIFASGLEGKSRIVRLDIESKSIKPLSDFGATQPAISNSGKLLAYIVKDKNNINRLMLMDLSNSKTVFVSDASYHAGFPTFSNDEKFLFYSSFYFAKPDTALEGNENAVIFKANIKNAFAANSAIKGHQLTSGNQSNIFLQSHNENIVYTSNKNTNLDIELMSGNGQIPTLKTPAEQLDYALKLDNDLDKLLALKALEAFDDSPEYQQALYFASTISASNMLFAKQKHYLINLSNLENAINTWQGLARIDLLMWDVRKTKALEIESGTKLASKQIIIALNKIRNMSKDYTTSEALNAYALLNEGDLLRFLGKDFNAIEKYDEIVNKYPTQRKFLLKAKIKQGEIYSQVKAIDLQTKYYISLLNEFPEYKLLAKQIIANIIKEYRQSILQNPTINALQYPAEFDSEGVKIRQDVIRQMKGQAKALMNKKLINHFRKLIESNPKLPLLGATLQFKSGLLYEETGKLDLAIRSMKQVAANYKSQKEQVTKAIFALGEYSLRLSKILRATKKYNEAGAYYADALNYFEQITKMYPADHHYHNLAKTKFLALGLLKAGQEENENDFLKARKSYQRLIDFDPNITRAYRKLIYYGVKDKQFKQLENKYKKAIKNNPADFFAHYSLGYLYTWKENPTESDLKKAESELNYARDLNSQNPYVYLTLGWVYYMRELYLHDISEGWLEQAISSYDKAYRLNDSVSDMQAEADILINLVTCFSRLGNTWHLAYDFATKRIKLDLAFLNKTREAFFYLNFGRSAFNKELYQEASELFEHSLFLAKQLEMKELEAELTARLALNYHMQGQFEQSITLFNNSIFEYKSIQRYEPIAALMRSVAINHYYLGQLDLAISTLNQSQEMLSKYGSISPEDFTRIALSQNMSLFPLGFDSSREEDVQTALYELILEDLEQFKKADVLLEKNIAYMDSWLANSGSSDADLKRELVVLNNRRARIKANLGDTNLAISNFDKAYLFGESSQATELDTKNEDYKRLSPKQQDYLSLEMQDSSFVFEANSSDFEAQIVNATAITDLLLTSNSKDKADNRELYLKHLDRLKRIAGRLKLLEQRGNTQEIRRDIIWRLYNDIGLLSLKVASLEITETNERQQTNDVQASFANFYNHANLFGAGIKYLLKLVKETAPPQKSTNENEEIKDDTSEDVIELDPDKDYSYLTIRTHLQALINLSELSAYFEDATEQANQSSRSFIFLTQALDLCEIFYVSDICFYADAIKLSRTNEYAKLKELVLEYAKTPATLFGSNYLASSKQLSDNIFNDAITHSLKNQNYQKALMFFEYKHSRFIADQINKLAYSVDSTEIKSILNDINLLKNNLDLKIKTQNYLETIKEKEERKKSITTFVNALLAKYKQLKLLTPRVHNILVGKQINILDSQKVLTEQEVILSLKAHNGRLYLILIDKNGVTGQLLNTKHENLLKDIAAIKNSANLHGNRLLALAKELKAIFKNSLSNPKLIYCDFESVANQFPLEFVLKNSGLDNTQFVNILSLGGLVDSFNNRNLFRATGLFTFPDSGKSSSDTKTIEISFNDNKIVWTLLKQEETTKSNVRELAKNSGVIFMGNQLTYEGASSANIWLNFRTKHHGLGNYRFIEHLDALWNTNAIVFSDTSQFSNRFEEKLLLERLLATLGIPGYILFEQNLTSEKPFGNLVASLAFWPRMSRADVFKLAFGNSLNSRFKLYGYAGMNHEQMQQYAKDSLMPSIIQGTNAQRAGANRAAMEAYERALLLIDYLGDYKFLDKTLQMLVKQSSKIKDYKRAIKYQLRVLSSADAAFHEDSKKVVALIKAKKMLAEYYTLDKQYNNALKQNQDIIDMLLTAKRKTLAAPYYSQRGLILEYATRYQEAFENYKTAYQIYTDKNDVNGRIRESRNSARILRLRLSRFAEAKVFVETAILLADKLLPYDKLTLKLGLSRIDLALGNFQKTADLSNEIIVKAKKEASAAYRQAMIIFKDKAIKQEKKKELLLPLSNLKKKMDALVLLSNIELCSALFRLGDYSQAMTIAEYGMKLSGKQISKQIIFNNVKGLIYSFLGDTKNAISTFKWTLEKATLTKDFGEQASSYNNLGDAYRKTGDFKSAKKMFAAAMQLDLKLKFKQGLAFDLANLGLVLENMKRYKQAVDFFNRALKISVEIKDPLNKIKSLLGLSRIKLTQKQFKSAENYLIKALLLVEDKNLSDWEWKVRLQFGKLKKSEGNFEQALMHFIKGIEVIEPMPAPVRVPKTGIKIEEEKSDLYDAALDILAMQQKTEEAFLISERARSRSFLDMVGSRELSFDKNSSALLISKLAKIKDELNSKHDDFQKAKNETQKQSTKEALDRTKADYAQSIIELGQLNEEYPSYVAVDALPYQKLAPLLPESLTLLSYFQTEHRLIVWIITATNIEMISLDQKRTDTIKLVEIFKRLTENFHPVKDVANKFYNLLLKPVAKKLPDELSRLVIVPHGALNFLPFAALYDGQSYAIMKYNFSYLSSVNQLRFIANTKYTKPQEMLAIGSVEDEQYSQLPFTKQELKSFSYTYKRANIFANNLATETNFKQFAKDQDWIHFASHSNLDKINPLESSLLLSADDKNDGLLHLSEVLSLGLDAKLVTLSACETSLGTLAYGHEIVGLSRAFLTAGSEQVISSLWRVSDLASAVLMKHFFREMKHKNPTNALRDAQLKIKKSFPHPSYWAGFRLEGRIDY